MPQNVGFGQVYEDIGMKVGDVLETLSSRLGWKADTPLEGLLAGSADIVVSGISTCAMPSVDVVRRTIAAKRNVILCDGHPFYLYDTYWSGLPGLQETIDKLPETAVKRRMIEDAGIAVIRVHSAWQAAQPASAAQSLARALKMSAVKGSAGQDFIVCDIPATSVAQLAQHIQGDGKRLIGNRDWPVSRVAIIPAMATPARLGDALRDQAVDAVIAGEVIEWEGGPYMIDVQGTGRKCALLLIGFANSLDPDATALAQWAKGNFPNIPVDVLHNRSDFIWSVKGPSV